MRVMVGVVCVDVSEGVIVGVVCVDVMVSV